MKLFATLWITVISLLVSNANATEAQTYILVHGALFTGDGWSRLESELQLKKHNVVRLNLPGRAGDGVDPKTVTVQVAAKKVCDVVVRQGVPVILVGHSQGGAVITQAFESCGHRVKALVYVAAVVPKSGETAFAKLDPKVDTNFLKCVTVDQSQSLFVLKQNGPLEASFFQDVRSKDAKLADLALASMVDEPLPLGNSPLQYNEKLFKAVPKFYVETTQDRVLSIGTQRRYQQTIPMSKVFTMNTSHSPFLSAPGELAKHLVTVAGIITAAPDYESLEIAAIRQFYDAFQTGDMATVERLMWGHIVWLQPGDGRLSGTYKGKAQVMQLFGDFAKLSDLSLKLEVLRAFQNEEFVTVHIHYSATRNGKILRGNGVDVFQVINGKIAAAMLFTQNQQEEDSFWSL